MSLCPVDFKQCQCDGTPDSPCLAVEALRKDAERYRWLRAQHWNTSPLCVVADPKDAVKLGHCCPSGDMLDMAVDDAMAAAPAVGAA